MPACDMSIVIPSWNGREILRTHLPSVLRAAEAAGDAEIVVADDNSTDGSELMLATEFPKVRIVRRPWNGGFAWAANDGVAAARGRNVFLINNDIELTESATRLLSARLGAHPTLFAVVPRILHATSGQNQASTRLRFRRGTFETRIVGSETDSPHYASGAAMAFRREDFLALGGFDTLLAPFYWEDVDLSYRARKRGRGVAMISEACVYHDHDKTIGQHFKDRARSRIYERNRLLFTWKNLTDPVLWMRHIAVLPPKCLWDLLAHRAFLLGLRDALRLRERVQRLRANEVLESVVTDRLLVGLEPE